MSFENILIVILSSSCIAALVSGITNYLQARKSDQLQYITDERRKWREDLRKIVEEIATVDVKKLSFTLEKLKVRVNAYGIRKSSSMTEDSYLWALFDVYDFGVINENNIKTYRKILIKAISLLLKSDWERYKSEVNGWKDSLLEMILFIFVNTFYCLGLKKVCTNDNLLMIMFGVIFIFDIYTIRNRLYSYGYKQLRKLEENKGFCVLEKNTLFVFVYCLLMPAVNNLLLHRNELRQTLLISFEYLTCIITVFMVWLGIWNKHIAIETQKAKSFIESCNILINDMKALVDESDNSKND